MSLWIWEMGIIIFILSSALLFLWAVWKFLKLKEEIEEKFSAWEECFNQRLNSHMGIVKRFAEERLTDFRKEIKKESPRKTSSQNRKVAAPLKVKKIR